jgi:hypothetical protein
MIPNKIHKIRKQVYSYYIHCHDNSSPPLLNPIPESLTINQEKTNTRSHPLPNMQRRTNIITIS